MASSQNFFFPNVDYTLFTMNTSAREVLQLYRNLLRYSRELKFTDKNYFKKRVRQEFEQNKELDSATDIEFNIKVSSCFINTNSIDFFVFFLFI